MRKTILVILFSCLLIGCAKIKPYEADIQQGNVIDNTVVEQLHLGMKKADVQTLLGTPVLGSTFDDDDWFYVYTNQINGGKIEKKTLALEFSRGKLIDIK